MSTPAKLTQRWPIYAGDPASIAITFTNYGTTTPATLTASGWTCMWRATRDAATAISATVDASEAVSSSRLTVSFTGTQTRAMAGKGVFDVQQIVDGGDPITYVTGETSWEEDVTR